MPPKTKKAAKAARYKFPRDYYKAACRARIKELHGDWTKAQIDGTLAWLWRHALEPAKQECADLQTSKSHDLPNVDDDIIPNVPKIATDEAPINRAPGPAAHPSRRATPEPQHGPVPEQGQDRPPGITVDDDMPTRRRKRRAMNTTSFTFMPNVAAMNDDIPLFADVGETLDSETEKRWLSSGLRFPAQEVEGVHWHGVRLLGEGAGGRVGLWVATDETNTLIQSLAVKDVVKSRRNWVSPIFWRDQLPREIAMQIRLNEVEAHKHQVHRYYGHRINFFNTRYRIFNEFCHLGNVYDAMHYYSLIWRLRRHMHRWHQIRLPEGENRRRAWEAYLRDSPRSGDKPIMFEPDETISQQEDVQRWQDNLEKYYEEMDEMGALKVWHDQEYPDEVEVEVILEAYLWTVFDRLVDAYLMLGDGKIDPAEDLPAHAKVEEMEAWQEMVHGDGHLANIFMKPVQGALVQNTKDFRYEKLTQDVPLPVLADFDWCFFDLASSDDKYRDNPFHYCIGEHPGQGSWGAGRYAPEFWFRYGRYNPRGHEPMSERTDVWQLGSMMFNLLLNLPRGHDFGGPILHFRDSNTGLWQESLLIGNERYSGTALDEHLFSGAAPYEASNRYSPDLKQLIRDCLEYDPNARPSMRELKEVTSQFAGKDPPLSSQAVGELVVRVKHWSDEFEMGETFAPCEQSGKGKRKR
ncbi:hypothetical protein J1614_008896 [Plenodomus biglobosus]|nr:hypothetical protein J1614_008896 [Plenodomus biglobosus]